MNIVKVDPLTLNFAKYNPRKDLKAGDKEYEKLKKSIQTFGYVDPIIVNKRNNVVVGGHQRLKVLIDLGYDEIDVVYVDLDDKDEKALNIGLNKISGDWDAEKLEDLLRELNNDESYDVTLTGFDLDELDTLFSGAAADLDQAEKDNKRSMKKAINIDDSLEQQLLDMEEQEPSEDNPRNIKPGDVFKLGRHMVFCGDSTNKYEILKFIKGVKFDLIMTDPPYDQDMSNRSRPSICALNDSLVKYKSEKHNYSMEKCEQYTEDIIDLSNWDPNLITWIKDLDIPSMFIFTSKNGVYKYLSMFTDVYNYDILFWCKADPTPFKNNSLYPDLEYMLYFYKKGHTFNNFDKPKAFKKYFLSSKMQGVKDNNNDKIHPTMKPLELISDKIQITSSDDGNVLDLFGGSGTTLVACEQTGRTCYMVEKSAKYMNRLIDRYEAITLDEAVFVKNLYETESSDNKSDNID
jgi:DNA modification methylase